jgi:plastocyanin
MTASSRWRSSDVVEPIINSLNFRKVPSGASARNVVKKCEHRHGLRMQRAPTWPVADGPRCDMSVLLFDGGCYMRGTLHPVTVVLLAATLMSCSDSASPKVDARVSAQDQCDPASFNAALGSGTCTKQGTVTLTAFNNELNSTHQVAAWRFVPTALSINLGQSIAVTNDGGEKHTFTEVANFGGGIVPALNSASGNPTEAPECAALAANAMIAPGTTFRTDAATDEGVEHYQCCIHPWMRATVTVTK